MEINAYVCQAIYLIAMVYVKCVLLALFLTMISPHVFVLVVVSTLTNRHLFAISVLLTHMLINHLVYAILAMLQWVDLAYHNP
jgi:hypothetical protein